MFYLASLKLFEKFLEPFGNGLGHDVLEHGPEFPPDVLGNLSALVGFASFFGCRRILRRFRLFRFRLGHVACYISIK